MDQQHILHKDPTMSSLQSIKEAISTSLSSSSLWIKMRLQQLTVGSLLTSSTLAVNLFVSSYSGSITTLQLTQNANGFSLKTLSVNNGSAPQPSWLEKHDGIIYAVNEDWARLNGTIASYNISDSGVLSQIDNNPTYGGPVSEVVYNEGKALAVAHYGGAAIQTWDIEPSGSLSLLQSFQFTLSAPGVIPDRQEGPHPHEVILDPKGSFIIVPDLGADLLRIFSIDCETSKLSESTNIPTPPGSGPRHGAFHTTEFGHTFFFLITELSNEVITYKVQYDGKSISFEEVFKVGTFGVNPIPEGAAAAEITVSPDGKHLFTSSRNFTAFTLPPFPGSQAGIKIPSDTLQTWEINQETGELTFKQLAPAGGVFPRHFSLNNQGSLAAVGLQSDGRVVIVEMGEDGIFGDIVASIEGLGGVNTVIWDE